MTRVLVAIIRSYQRFVSPLLPRTCRFQPTCSEYAVEALLRYGLWRGLLVAGARLLRCHPFSPGGYDPVEPEPGPERLHA